MKASKRAKKAVKKAALVGASKAVARAAVATKKGRPPTRPSKEPPLPHLRERWPRNNAERKARAAEYYKRLLAAYPDAHCALDHEDPYQLLVATILSAQCTDKRVNMVTPELFKRYPNAAALADADTGELETAIKSTGFFRSKSKSLLGMARALVERHDGEVPSTMEELIAPSGRGPQDRERDPRQRLRQESRDRRRHARHAALEPARPHARGGRREDRAGSDAALPSGAVDDGVASVDRARPSDLHRAQSEVRELFAQRHLPVVAGVMAKGSRVQRGAGAINFPVLYHSEFL